MIQSDDEPISTGILTWNTTAANSQGGHVFSDNDKTRPTGGSGPPGGGGGDEPPRPEKKDTQRGKKTSFKEPSDGCADDPGDDDLDEEDWDDDWGEWWEEGEEEEPCTGSENCTEPSTDEEDEKLEERIAELRARRAFGKGQDEKQKKHDDKSKAKEER